MVKVKRVGVSQIKKEVFSSPIIIIGYWGQSKEDTRYPWPQDYVDEEQSETMINIVADYLDAGKPYEQYFGWSNCRICGERNGSVEFTDGTYAWPSGLSHYVRGHKVRLPEKFITHIINKLEEE